MPVDFLSFRVELRRHVGYMYVQGMGMLPFEHPQKMVLVYPPKPEPGAPILQQVGYLPDADGASLLPLPEIWEEMPQGLRDWISEEAERLKQAGEFVDPPDWEG